MTQVKHWVGIVSIFSLFAGLTAMADDVAGHGQYWIDNFGKIWTVNTTECLNGNGFCVEGSRDTNNSLHCGALPVRGLQTVNILGANVIALTVFSNSTKCSASAWTARFDETTGTFQGMVTDNTGKQTPFTLSPSILPTFPGDGFVPGSSEEGDYDPSLAPSDG